jgi:GNAT superfamily N-acetyltransferase
MQFWGVGKSSRSAGHPGDSASREMLKVPKTLSGNPFPKGLSATPKISLRPARQEDHDFAGELYLDSARPLLTALGMWHKVRIITRFRKAFKFEQAHVIRLDGTDIGWMQVSESADRLHLHQLHIISRFRNRGIGTCLIQSLLERARRMGLAVALNVIRGNRALSLYRRLGFRVVGGDAEKLNMRWEAKRL